MANGRIARKEEGDHRLQLNGCGYGVFYFVFVKSRTKLKPPLLMIDVNADYYEDTPIGKDPDCFSPSLNQHHSALWSKRLPNKQNFLLEPVQIGGRLLLAHQSKLGKFVLSSDMIVHSLYDSSDNGLTVGEASYRKFFPSHLIRNEVPKIILDFWERGGIACYTLFPARGRHTINRARGLNRKICDRFDLTLECIRRFYGKKNSINPLGVALKETSKFFNLFGSFRGYVDFFFFQDLVSADYKSIKFWLPFDDFNRSPLPQNSDEYRRYKKNVCTFIERRRRRISAWLKNSL